jgi:hypothetical protein
VAVGKQVRGGSWFPLAPQAEYRRKQAKKSDRPQKNEDFSPQIPPHLGQRNPTTGPEVGTHPGPRHPRLGPRGRSPRAAPPCEPPAPRDNAALPEVRPSPLLSRNCHLRVEPCSRSPPLNLNVSAPVCAILRRRAPGSA